MVRCIIQIRLSPNDNTSSAKYVDRAYIRRACTRVPTRINTCSASALTRRGGGKARQACDKAVLVSPTRALGRERSKGGHPWGFCPCEAQEG